VNQQGAAAATAILQHLHKPPSRVLEAVLNEHAVQRVLHSSRQPLVAPTHQHPIEQQQQAQQQQQQAQQPQQQHDELAKSLVLATHAAQQHELNSSLQLLNKLLLLAAARRHISLMLLLLKNELQPLPAATIRTLLLAAMRSSSSSSSSAGSSEDSKARDLLLQRLCRLPTARQLDAAQVCKLLLEALRLQQLRSLQQLGHLPGAQQLSSSQARDLVLEALHWGCYGAFKALVRVIDILQPQHLLQLLKRATLLATLGSRIELQEPWCDERMRAYGIKFPGSPWKEGYMVVRLLRSAHAAGDIPRAGVHELLLTAAALGNGDVLAMLWNGGMAARARDSDLAAEMLQCAVQFRDSHMLSCVEVCLGKLLRDADYEELTELAVGLVRTDEGTALAHLVNGLAKWLPQYVQDDLPELLQLAGD
jgi:hypothetical protein